MSELNREQIKKALEEQLENYRDCEQQFKIELDITKAIVNALAFINELTEENTEVKTSWQKLKESHESACEKCRAEFKRLTEENESLRAEKEHLELVVEGKLKRTSALEKQVLSLTEENERLRAENKIEYETPLGKQTMPNLLHLEGDVARLYTQIKNETKADTVRDIQTAFAVHFGTYTDTDTVKVSDVFRFLDIIANELLGETDDK